MANNDDCQEQQQQQQQSNGKTSSLLGRTKALFSSYKRSVNDENEVQSSPQDDAAETPPVLIVGAGIVGLVLALALEKHCGIRAELYEQAPAFHEDVGAGMGIYPNGLRVIRDISPDLLQAIQDIGYPYLLRRLERHDGTEVATADERKLFLRSDAQEELEDLQPMGLRRWKLQQILYKAVEETGIKIHFGMRLKDIQQDQDDENKLVHLTFQDGTKRTARLLLAADGSKSQSRTIVSEGKYQLKYTGTTCLMGIANVGRSERGLALPSSDTTKCHGAFYPTGENEQCFQFHFPMEYQATPSLPSDPKNFSWGSMPPTMEEDEMSNLIERLVADGWDEAKYIQPLRNVEKALKIGFSTLEPHLETYVFGRVVLLGDSAHPPVPYLGQGAQQGIEDAGTLALLLKEFCSGQPEDADFDLTRVDQALELYNRLRQPRTEEILNNSKLWGSQQQKRATNHRYNQSREENIRREIFYHETLPILLPAVRHDYKEDVNQAILELETRERQARAKAKLVHPASSDPSGEGQEHLLPVPEETSCH